MQRILAGAAIAALALSVAACGDDRETVVVNPQPAQAPSTTVVNPPPAASGSTVVVPDRGGTRVCPAGTVC